MHVRRQIRQAVVVALTGMTTTAGRVFDSRVYPMESATMPGLCVYTLDEEAGREETQGAFKLERELPVIVEAYAADETPQALLDDIAEEVEEALGTADLLGGLARAFVGPVVTETQQPDPETELPATVMRLEFRYLYLTAKGAPGVAL